MKKSNIFEVAEILSWALDGWVWGRALAGIVFGVERTSESKLIIGLYAKVVDWGILRKKGLSESKEY